LPTVGTLHSKGGRSFLDTGPNTLSTVLDRGIRGLITSLQFNQETADDDDETGQNSSNGECSSFQTCVDTSTFHLQTQQIRLLSGATTCILPKVCGCCLVIFLNRIPVVG
jgi:hypothetical protein